MINPILIHHFRHLFIWEVFWNSTTSFSLMPVYIQEAVYIKGAIKSLWTAAALPCNALCNTTTDYNAPPAYLVTTPKWGQVFMKLQLKLFPYHTKDGNSTVFLLKWFYFQKLNRGFKMVLTPLCHRLRLNWVSLCKQIIACGWLQSHAKPPHD